MSYSITEAERKHVATIEDVRFNLERLGTAEDTTPQYNLHMTDGDKLDLNIDLPKLRFECNNEDDAHSRIRVITQDSIGEDREIVLDGLTGRSGNPLGLGWRFKVTFGTDDDGFIDRLIVERKNDGKTWTNEIKAFSDLVIKNLIIGSDEVENSGNLEVKGTTTLKGSLDAKDASFNGVEIGKEDTAIRTNGNKSYLDETSITKANITDLNISDGTTNINNETVNINNSHVIGNEDSSIDVSNLDATNLAVNRANISTLEAEKITSQDTTLNGRTFIHDELSVDKLNVVGKTDTKDLRVLDQFEANNAAVNNAVVNNKLISKSVAAETATISSETVENLTATNVRASDINAIDISSNSISSNIVDTNRLKANTVISDVADFEETDSKIIRTTNIRSVDDRTNFISETQDEINVGDGNKELILNSAPSGSNQNSRFYNRIKVICGDNIAHLATLEDLREENLNGVVDLTTSQVIGGVKTFKNHIISEVGLVSPDDADSDKIVNLISRMWDPNDPVDEGTTNPEYETARVMAEAYDGYYASYGDVVKKYTAALRAKQAFGLSAASLDANNERLNNSRTSLELVENDIATTTERLETTRANKARDEAERADKVSEVTLLGGSAFFIHKKNNHDAAVVELERLKTILETVANSDGATSLLFNNESLNSLKDASVSIGDKIETLRSFITSYDESDWALSYEIVDREIRNLYNEEFVVDQTIKTLTKVADFTSIYDFLKEEIDGFGAPEETSLSKCIELEESVENLTRAVNGYISNIESDTASLETLNTTKSDLEDTISDLISEISTLTLEKSSKEQDFTSKWIEYASLYASYEGTTLDQNILIEPIDPKTKVENFDEALYKRFKYGLIKQIIPSAEHDKIIVLGNGKDELQIETDALENGDEHIQATIGGHLHKLANLDDMILPGFASGTNDKVIGDVDINTTENEIEFNVTTNAVKKASISEESGSSDLVVEPETKTNKIFTIKGSECIKISKVENEEDSAVIELDAEKFEEKLKNRDSKFYVSKIENVNGTIIEQKYDDDTLVDSFNFKSDRNHLIITNDGNKTTSIDVNVYEPDLDLGNETVEGYVNAYNNLEATSKNLDLIPNAIAVKSLHSDSGKKIQNVKLELDTRVPPSPKMSGRYGLVATVVNNPNGGVTSVYSWDGSQSGMPSIYTVSDEESANAYIDIDGVSTPITLSTDWNGNPLRFYTQNDPVEYVIKMRLMMTPDDTGKPRITPVINWMPIDYDGSYVPPVEDPNDNPPVEEPDGIAYIGEDNE